MMRTVYQEFLRMETLKGTISAKSFHNLGLVLCPLPDVYHCKGIPSVLRIINRINGHWLKFTLALRVKIANTHLLNSPLHVCYFRQQTHFILFIFVFFYIKTACIVVVVD